MANGLTFLAGMSLLSKQKFFFLASTYSWTSPARSVPDQRVLGVCPTDPGFPHLEALLS